MAELDLFAWYVIPHLIRPGALQAVECNRNTGLALFIMNRRYTGSVLISRIHDESTRY